MSGIGNVPGGRPSRTPARLISGSGSGAALKQIFGEDLGTGCAVSNSSGDRGDRKGDVRVHRMCTRYRVPRSRF